MGSTKTDLKKQSLHGLLKIATGKTNDALALIFFQDELTAEKLKALDCFQISEIKRDKDGGVQIKFYDRREALELLYRISDEIQNQRSAENFIAEISGQNLEKN